MSIAFDSAGELAQAAQDSDVGDVPLLTDADHSVSEAYEVLQWATGSGEPGHTFVLVDAEGRVAWIRDYGAPQNGGVMYVPPQDLVAEIRAALNE